MAMINRGRKCSGKNRRRNGEVRVEEMQLQQFLSDWKNSFGERWRQSKTKWPKKEARQLGNLSFSTFFLLSKVLIEVCSPLILTPTETATGTTVQGNQTSSNPPARLNSWTTLRISLWSCRVHCKDFLYWFWAASRTALALKARELYLNNDRFLQPPPGWAAAREPRAGRCWARACSDHSSDQREAWAIGDQFFNPKRQELCYLNRFCF